MTRTRSRRSKFGRWLLGFTLLGAAVTGFLLADAWTALGRVPSSSSYERLSKSPRFVLDHFENSLPTAQPRLGAVFAAYWENDAVTSPKEPLPVLFRKASEFTEPKLRVTWLGHSTLLIEVDSHRLLTDPVWGERASPSSFFGPARFHSPPLPLSELPALDGVLISHDHYDHLDEPTIAFLRGTGVHFYVPLGVGSHLDYWGVEPGRVTELDWWQTVRVGELEITATPSRHFSGRDLHRDRTLWASYAIVGPRHRVYFSGDTSMTPDFRVIGERLGPFDLTLLEAGAYNPLWADVHLGPEQAVQAHQLLGGKRLVPVHWGTFNLALHAWTEPPERLLRAAKKAGVDVVIPRPGESVTPDSPAPPRYWPEIPWQTAEEAPVVSSHLEGL